jgi:hypothetical protein
MSGEGVEVGIEAIAGKEGQAARSQLLSQAVDEPCNGCADPTATRECIW